MPFLVSLILFLCATTGFSSSGAAAIATTDRPLAAVPLRQIATEPGDVSRGQGADGQSGRLGLGGNGGNADPARPAGEQSCFEVTETVLSCSKSECEHTLRRCDLEIDYTFRAANIVFDSVNTSFVCRARITYRTLDGIMLNSESCSEPAFHDIRSETEGNSSVNLVFHFSSYERVVGAGLDSVECYLNEVMPEDLP